MCAEAPRALPIDEVLPQKGGQHIAALWPTRDGQVRHERNRLARINMNRRAVNLDQRRAKKSNGQI